MTAKDECSNSVKTATWRQSNARGMLSILSWGKTHIPVWQPTIMVAVTILYLTLAPSPLGETEIELFEGADKVVHAIMFGTLTFVIDYDLWSCGKKMTKLRFFIVAVGSIAFGGLTEILQGSMGLGRGEDFVDFLADCAGVALATISARLLLFRTS